MWVYKIWDTSSNYFWCCCAHKTVLSWVRLPFLYTFQAFSMLYNFAFVLLSFGSNLCTSVLLMCETNRDYSPCTVAGAGWGQWFISGLGATLVLHQGIFAQDGTNRCCSGGRTSCIRCSSWSTNNRILPSGAAARRRDGGENGAVGVRRHNGSGGGQRWQDCESY